MAAVLVVGLGAAAYVTLGRGSVGASSSPTPSPDIHSKEAVIAAVQAYYKAEDKAGETGNVELVKAFTTGPGTPAYENLKQFFVEQTAKNRHSVTIADNFSGWQIAVGAGQAIASYGIVQVGHDIDASTGKPVETDMRTTRAFYKATLKLQANRWVMYARDFVREEPS